MIICIDDDYMINLPDGDIWEATIDRKSSYADSVISFSFAQQVIQRRVEHIPDFKKIPLAIAMSIHLGRPSLFIDKEFKEVYSELLNEWITD